MSTNRIKQLRIEKGLTLGQLAEKVGLSESHLSRVEAGVRGVKLSKLGALAKVLGVPMIELMPQESFEHASDLAPYVPPKGSAVEKALASSSQRMFRVLSGVLSELEINENDLIIADCSKDAIAQVVSGSLVVAEAINTRTGEKTLLLRQFISPHLLITNSENQNSNCCANSASVFSPFMAAKATFALKPGVWFRRGLLLIVSPEFAGLYSPLSGRRSTYRPVRISGTTSKCGRRIWPGC